MTKKTYGLYAQQRGEGCDYTIGCGRNFYVLGELEEHEIDAAIREVVEDNSLGSEERELEEFALVVIIKDLDVEAYQPDDDSEDEETARRRHQYEVLKREFG